MYASITQSINKLTLNSQTYASFCRWTAFFGTCEARPRVHRAHYNTDYNMATLCLRHPHTCGHRTFRERNRD